jgi:hypothetical protein
MMYTGLIWNAREARRHTGRIGDWMFCASVNGNRLKKINIKYYQIWMLISVLEFQ